MTCSLAASIFVVLTGALTGCAADTPGGEEEDVESTSDALSTAGGIEVVQVNPFYAGAYEKPDRTSEKSWHTAKRFGHALLTNHTHAAVIGMQEVESAAAAEKVRGILNVETGRPWAVRWFNKKIGSDDPATGEAIFWRPAVFDKVDDFGTKEVEDLDQNGKRDLSVRFGGLLLQRKGTTRKLAVFTGKLARFKSRSDGNPIDNGDRAKEIRVLKRWIDEKTAAHRRASRVVLMDMNATYGSEPHAEMMKEYQDGGGKEHTHFTYGPKRLDYIFWDYDSGKKRPDGIFGPPHVSADFGSDHRFVSAKVYMRSEGE